MDIEVSNEEGANHMMFIVRMLVAKGRDDVWEYILANYEKMRSSTVSPLYVTKRLSKGETTLFIDAKNSSEIADFLLKHFSHLESIQDISVVNLMRPVFFPLPQEHEGMKRFTIALTCAPKYCESIYKNLLNLKPNEDGAMTYMAYTFKEKGEDILLSVLSKDTDTLERFIHGHITPLEGITNLKASEINKTRKLATMFEWKQAVHPLTVWENLTSRDYKEDVFKDVIAGC
jgi:hypothetical protein